MTQLLPESYNIKQNSKIVFIDANCHKPVHFDANFSNILMSFNLVSREPLTTSSFHTNSKSNL